jgi:hypothetical protein
MAQVIISIPSGQWADFQKYYLLRRPMPLDDEQEPIMSVSDWIKQNIVSDIYQTLLGGKQMEALNELLDEISIEIT